MRRPRCFRAMTVAILLLGGTLVAANALALEAEVKPHAGSPVMFINGKPGSPIMFFGWAGGDGAPTPLAVTTDWKQYHLTFTCPEDVEDRGGIHFRLGGGEPGTVWVDNVQFYPGAFTEQPTENYVRQGDWEGTRAQFENDWRLFCADYAKAEADWQPDATNFVTGRQSLRVDIKSPGENTMHVHFYQSGYKLTKGQRYTYSLWMKADKPRAADFMALRIGPPYRIYGTEDSSYQQQVALARDAGVHIYSFGIGMPWPRPGEQPDFSGVDAAFDLTLATDPDALLFPRFGMTPPQWWLEDHPDDNMVFEDGSRSYVCMASEPWRAEMQEHLRALVRHCEDNYGDHMLGYHPCGQHTGEWFYERSWEAVLSDFSPAMSKGFSKWAATRYGTVEALRHAWGDAQVTFDTIAVPSAENQRATKLGFFRDPASERSVIDYFEYKQLAMEEPLETMARVIKQETDRKKLVCLFYGYLFDMHGTPMGPQNTGHLAMARMVQCPDVDILCSPISYLDRELGGAGMFMSAVDTVRGAGKLWLNEDDTRTYLTPPDSGFGRVDTPEGTFEVHQRNFAQIWPRRLACWYMDLGGIGWLNGVDIWRNIAPLQAFYNANIDQPASWAPEVALIVDEQSPFYTRCDRSLHSPLVYGMRSQYFRMGTPFSIHLLSDLAQAKVPPAKAYFFANCYHLDDATRQAVLDATRGKTAVWFYGGGFLSNDASEASMAQMLGMNLQRGTPQPGTVTPDPAAAGLAEGLTKAFGGETVLDPIWSVTDADAGILGRYADGTSAVASRQTPDGLRVYIGALNCPARLLRNVLKAGGVHLYSDSDDVILADEHFLAVTATSEGAKTISLPRRCKVTSVPDGALIAEAAETLSMEMKLGETRMFALE